MQRLLAGLGLSSPARRLDGRPVPQRARRSPAVLTAGPIHHIWMPRREPVDEFLGSPARVLSARLADHPRDVVRHRVGTVVRRAAPIT